jgi:mannosyltransferase
MSRDRWTTIAVIAAVLVGAWIRLAGIGTQSLWLDEGYTAWLVNHPPAEIIRLVQADTSPPLYYLMLHEWTLLFGRSEAALRSLSAVFGIVTIPLVACIAKRMIGRPVAATWLFTVSWLQIAYSQEARSYELGAFLAAVAFYALLRHLDRPHWKWLALITAATAAGFYVNNFMLFYAAAIGLAGLVYPSKLTIGRRLRDGLIVAICSAIAFLPWIVSFGSQMRRVNGDFWISRPNPGTICLVLANLAGVDRFWTWEQFVPRFLIDASFTLQFVGAIVLICATAIGVWIISAGDRRSILTLAIMVFFAPFAAAAYSLWGRSIFLTRGCLPSGNFMPILLAAPARKRHFFGRAIVAAMLAFTVVNLYAWHKESVKEDWRGAAAAVTAMPTVRHRLIVFVANETQLPFDYYYHPRAGETETGAPAGFFDIDPPHTQERVLRGSDLARLRQRVNAGGFDDLVLVVSHAAWPDSNGRIQIGYSDPDALTARYLLSTMRELQEVDISDVKGAREITIWRFAPN